MTSCAAETDPEQALHHLVTAGYRFVHPRDDGGEIMAVVGFRVHGNVVDVVRITDADEAAATRMSADEPDVLAPDEPLWQRTGRVAEVVDELLTLTDDDHPPMRAEPAKGCWVPAGDGRSAFLLAG